MLDDTDEQRIEYMCEQLGTEGLLGVDDQKWLVTKLRETNDELAKVHLELQQTNEELARVWEVYGP